MPSRLAWAEPLVARLRPSGSRLTPEEDARRAVLEGAQRAVHRAERQHASRVKAAQRQLRRAERAHDAGVRKARKELRHVERAAESAIAEAEKRVVVVTSTRELAQYGSLRLYEDRVDTGYEIVPLAPGFRAFVGPVAVLARTGPESGIPERVLDAHGRPRRSRSLSEDRLYLALEGAQTRLLIEMRDEAGARRFAQLVDVAVLNVARVLEARREAGANLDRAAGEVRRVRTEHVEHARTKLEAVAADRDAIETAARALAEAEADTSEIERRRAALAAVEREQGDEQPS